MTSAAEFLDSLTVEGELFAPEADDAVRCLACGHRCLIRPGKRGICQVRFNQGGKLRVPFGYVAALQSDPIEKKPFNHVLPGSNALTFGMLGCDFHCGYCQNWFTSQALRDPASDGAVDYIRRISPGQVTQAAQRTGASVVVSSYNEPLITSEWAVAIFKEAKSAGLKCAYVSNGNNTPEAMAGGYVEAAVDLMEVAHRDAQRELRVFARAEHLDLEASLPSNGISTGTNVIDRITTGITYRPAGGVVIKGDVTVDRTGVPNPALYITPYPASTPFHRTNSYVNVGLGYSF